MLFDAHCHVNTDFDPSRMDELVECYNKPGSPLYVLMSSNHIDCDYVQDIATRVSTIVPAFGIHPWYSHLFTLEMGTVDKKEHYEKVFGKEVDDQFLSVLPEPMSFHQHMDKLLEYISKHNVVCWGEVGLDKLFRVPNSGFYGNPAFKDVPSDELRMTNYRVLMDHQKEIFEQQLEVAFQKCLPLSIHCVKAAGLVHDCIKKTITPTTRSAVCLHSFTGSVDTLKLFINTFKKHKSAKFYASFSSVINNSDKKARELNSMIGVLPKEAILSETDVPLDRYMDDGGPTELLEDIVNTLGGYCNESQLLSNGSSFLGISG